MLCIQFVISYQFSRNATCCPSLLSDTFWGCAVLCTSWGLLVQENYHMFWTRPCSSKTLWLFTYSMHTCSAGKALLQEKETVLWGNIACPKNAYYNWKKREWPAEQVCIFGMTQCKRVKRTTFVATCSPPLHFREGLRIGILSCNSEWYVHFLWQYFIMCGSS